MESTLNLRTGSMARAMVAGGSAASASGLSVKLHPLALLNISDHFTRCRLSSASTPMSKTRRDSALTSVIGAILGSQSNRELAIVNTFEIRLLQTDNDIDAETLDADLLESRREQFLQVFPTLDIIGWYSNGDIPTSTHASIHKQIASIIDSPIFLLYTSTSPSSQELPVTIFEATSLDLGDPSPGPESFLPLEYGIETGEAERIAVDGVARGDMGGDEYVGAVAGNLTTQRNAIRMLYERAQVIREYLDGLSHADHSIMRQISSLVSALPSMDTTSFEREISTDSQDAHLNGYLAALTKQLDALSEYGNKHGHLWPARSEDYNEFSLRPGMNMGGRVG